ncbi:MAG: ATP-binding protein [Chloroflexaceae bacterium]
MDHLKHFTKTATSSLFTSLHTFANASLINGRYNQTLLQHLMERLQSLTLGGGNGALIMNTLGAPDGTTWLPAPPPEIRRLVLPPAIATEQQEVLFCVLGGAGSAVLCGQVAEDHPEDPDARIFDLVWSFDPAIVTYALDWIGTVLQGSPEQQATFHRIRQDFPLPDVPNSDMLLRLSAHLLAFDAHENSTLVTANNELAARLRWHEDQTRMMVHDIRAPLHTLLISLKALLPQQLDPVGQHELLLVAYESARLLENLIETTMDSLRLDTGKLPVRYQELPVDRLVQAVCEPFELTGRSDQPQIRWDVSADLPPLRGDRGLLERVLTNLLSNAIKFTPATGEIDISSRLSDTGQAIELLVRDTGEGIPLEAQPHIFKRFYQANSKDGRRGVGLGLYFCRGAVEAHHGTISFTSTPGVGSTFKVTLPLKPPEQPDEHADDRSA